MNAYNYISPAARSNYWFSLLEAPTVVGSHFVATAAVVETNLLTGGVLECGDRAPRV